MTGTEPATSLVSAIERRIPGTHVSLTPTVSLITAVQAIERGDTDLGLAFADAAYTSHVLGGGLSRLRAVASLNVTPFVLLVHPDSGIRRITDLPGHTVRLTSQNPGDPRFRLPFRHPQSEGPHPEAATVSSLSELIVGAFGIRPSQLRLMALAPADGLAALRAGTVEAYFTSAPDDDLVRQAVGGGARIVPIGGPQVDDLRRRYPFVQHVRIPAGTYPGQDRRLHTVGVGQVLICRADLDPGVVYRVTRALIQEFEQVTGHDSVLGRIRLDRAPVTPIPLHPGAARFYREWELFR